MAKRHRHELGIRRAINQLGVGAFYAKHGRKPPLAYSTHPDAQRLLADFAQIEADELAQVAGVADRFATMPKPSGRLQ